MIRWTIGATARGVRPMRGLTRGPTTGPMIHSMARCSRPALAQDTEGDSAMAHRARSRSARNGGRVSTLHVLAGLPIALGAAITVAWAALPPVPTPPENPITEPKRVLGKILFFDEQ